MLSHKTVSDKRQRKGALSRIRGFLKSALRGAPAPDPPIDYLAVGESTAGSGRCVCQARGVAEAGGGGPVTMQRVVNYGECCAAASRNVCRLSLPFNLLFFFPPLSSPPSLPPNLETELPLVFSPSCRDRAKRWHPRPQKRQAARVVPPPRRREIVD